MPTTEFKPKVRRLGLLVECADDECVVYDLHTGVLHALSPLATAVFLACDGDRTNAQLAAVVSGYLGREPAGAEIQTAIDQLEARLLLDEPQRAVKRTGLTRRERRRADAAACWSTQLMRAVLGLEVTCGTNHARHAGTASA